MAAATDGLVLVDRYQSKFRSRDVVALLLLAFGGFIFAFGWFVGVLLLWTSDRWTKTEKILGTAPWPFGYAFVGFLLNFYAPIDIPVWVAWPVWAVIAVSQVATTTLLIKNAGPKRS